VRFQDTVFSTRCGPGRGLLVYRGYLPARRMLEDSHVSAVLAKIHTSSGHYSC
jgi:hypothetical protein